MKAKSFKRFVTESELSTDELDRLTGLGLASGLDWAQRIVSNIGRALEADGLPVEFPADGEILIRYGGTSHPANEMQLRCSADGAWIEFRCSVLRLMIKNSWLKIEDWQIRETDLIADPVRAEADLLHDMRDLIATRRRYIRAL